MTPLLAGRVAFITGAGSGIGRAIAKRFAEEGADVAVVDLNEAAASETVDAIPALGRHADVVCADVASAADVETVAQRVQTTFGRIDILVNNAGVTRDALIRKMADEEWDLVIGIHLKGTFLCTRTVAARIREAGRGGAIVNMSSISGKIGNFGQANYAAAKAGIVALTKVTGVVPFAMKRVWFDVERLHRVIGHLHPRRIFAPVHLHHGPNLVQRTS